MKSYAKKLTVRLSESEYLHLKQLAEASGLKMEPTIRKLILGTELRPRPPAVYADLLRELSAIGNNINQIAHWANVMHGIPAQRIEEAQTLVRQAFQLLKERI